MADELSVVVKTKLEVDKQQARQEINSFGEEYSNSNKKSIKLPIDIDKKTSKSNISAAIPSLAQSIANKPIKAVIGIDETASLKKIRTAITSLQDKLKKKEIKIDLGVGSTTGSSSGKSSKSSKTSIGGVDFKEIAGAQKYVDKLVEKAKDFEKSFKDATAKIASTDIAYKPLEKMWQATVKYEDSIGRVTSMMFSMNEDMEEVNVTQLKLTENEKKYRAEVERTQKTVADYETKLANLRSRAFSQKNPIPEQYSGELNDTFAEIETTLKGIGTSISSETQIALDRLLSEADTKIKEIRAQITTATDLRSKDVSAEKAVQENELNTFVVQMRNAGLYTEEMQQRVSWLRQELAAVNDSASMNDYLNDLSEAESRLGTLREELRGTKDDYKNLFDQAIGRENERMDMYRQMFDDIQHAEDAAEEQRQNEYRALFDQAQRRREELERVAAIEREIAEINERRDSQSHDYWQKQFKESIDSATATNPDLVRTRQLYEQEMREADKKYQTELNLDSKKSLASIKLDGQISDLRNMGLEANELTQKLIDLRETLDHIDDNDSFAVWENSLKRTRTELDSLMSSFSGDAYQTALSIDSNQLHQISRFLNYDAIASSSKDGATRLREELLKLQTDYVKLRSDMAKPLLSGADIDAQKINEFNVDLENLDDRFVSLARQAKLFNGSLTSNDAIAKADMQIEKLKNDLNTMEINWSKALEIPELKADIDAMRAALERADAANLPMLQKSFTELRSKIKAAGADCKSFGDRLSDAFNQVKEYFSIIEIFQKIKEVTGEVVKNVKEVNTAMTELKKVTSLSESGYEDFVKNAADRSKVIGTNLVDYIASTADFARLGYDAIDAQTLSESTNILYKVGDNLNNIEQASDAVIASMAAYGMEVSDVTKIVDMFNEVSNRTSIDTGGLTEAITHSASALAVAGLDLDKSMALIVAGNETVRNASMTGRYVARCYSNVA